MIRPEFFIEALREKGIDCFAGVPDSLFFLKDISHPHLVLSEPGSAVESGCGSHHHGLSIEAEIREAPFAEILRIVYRQGGHGIESAFRHGGDHSRNLPEAVNEEVPSGLVFFEALAGILFRTFY